MPGPKAKLPAPIDRPLSRAYLREFTGWSTAYPPGLSDPTSLRVMENVAIGRDGAARVRPGLRHLSYASPRRGESAGTGVGARLVGTHEAFYLDNGNKAYLFAVMEVDGTVGFRVLTFIGSGPAVRELDDPNVGFTVDAGLNFTSATTYVKYLQIDNKIFALSNSGAEADTMRLFTVGATKKARVLFGINHPDWSLESKLTVVEPEATWITNGIPTVIRANRVTNPSFEAGFYDWEMGALTDGIWAVGEGNIGSTAASVTSLPQRTNLCEQPLHDVATAGITGWSSSSVGSPAVSASASYLRVNLSASSPLDLAVSSYFDVTAGEDYHMAADVLEGTSATGKWRVQFYNSGGTQVGTDKSGAFTTGRPVTGKLTAPAGAISARIFLGGTNAAPFVTPMYFKNVVFCEYSESTAAFSGASGSDYFWTGTTNGSPSVYHPPADVTLTTVPSTTGGLPFLVASIYVRAATAVRNTFVTAIYTGGSFTTSSVAGSGLSDAVGSWVRPYVVDAVVPGGASLQQMRLTIEDVPRGEIHYVDNALVEVGLFTLGTYFDGDTADTPTAVNYWTGMAHFSPTYQQEYVADLSIPTAETPTADTLISSTRADNEYNFGLFYTFSNAVGESAASQVTKVGVQRPWSGWAWETPNASGEPSGTAATDPIRCADQLVAVVPQATFEAAVVEGAEMWSLYLFTWSNQDPIPVSAVKVASKELSSSSIWDNDGWLRVTPVTSDIGTEVAVLPSAANRYNYSEPSRGGQGLVAADRMIMVYDPTAPAVIRWTSNQQGEYTNFTAAKGGGYKTLTSGNLFVPACVKLWQNPQSADTLTILCLGTDGYSTGYYMSPAQVAAQSEAVNIMGFEETTATPGTTSPYGVEVFNNALYHPLDDQLMKSTATNYNINHKALTDQIQDVWMQLSRKDLIVSSLHDGSLYYIVYNPAGEALEAGCRGNEIWVFDAMAKAGTWSRWLIQAHSLRRVEQDGQLYMSVVKPEGIFYLDPLYAYDDSVTDGTNAVTSQPIPWRLETNTQGANRAHDAWAHLQQVTLNLGYFQGTLRYGIRSFDFHGQPVEISKLVTDNAEPDTLAFDFEDYLQIRRDLKEWFFFAESVTDDEDAVVPSYGQINLVQYRYTPSTVNTGYEYGSVETFEYGRAAAGVDTYTTNGTPVPMIDTRRP